MHPTHARYKLLALSFSLVLTQFASPSAFAEAPACMALFEQNGSNARYDWLRTASPERDEWINSQVGDVNATLAKSKNFPLVNRYFKNLLDRADIASQDKMGDLTVTLLNRGMGPGKSTDVMITEGDVAPVRLLSSYDLRRNNTFMPTSVAISPDGKYITVSASERGSIDVYTQIIFDAKTKKEVGRVSNTDSEDIVWLGPDTFMYENYSAPPRSQMLGVIKDGALMTGANPKPLPLQPALGGKLLFASGKDVSFFVRFGDKDAKPLQLPVGRVQGVIKADATSLLLQTRGANGFGEIKQVTLDTNTQGERTTSVKTIVPETNFVIKGARLVGDALVVSTFRGEDRIIHFYTQAGEPAGKLKMPGCCAGELRSVDLVKKEVTIALSSPVSEGVVFKHDLANDKWLVSRGGDFVEADPAKVLLRDGYQDYVVEYVNYKSADGETIPLRITRKKDLRRDGTNPVYMQGYGGFGVNSYFHPFFEPMTREFLRRGGIHVAPALRGSVFFGQPWHDAGRALNKQNVINDFVAAAETVIGQGWTAPKKIAIAGASHGGLLVGAAITQRPDLFGLAFPKFGPQDFARKPELDPNTTPLQVGEYGDLYNDPAAQALAKKISPFDNIKPTEYPTTLVITGRGDSRVNPTHSYLFAAKLKEAQQGPGQVQLFALKNSGHWAESEPLQDLIAWRENVVYWTYIYDYFNMPAP